MRLRSTRLCSCPNVNLLAGYIWCRHTGQNKPSALEKVERLEKLFPLRFSHPNPIKTRNPTPARSCNFRFQPLFSDQISHITAKNSKSRIPPNLLGTLIKINQITHIPLSVNCSTTKLKTYLDWLSQTWLFFPQSHSLHFDGTDEMNY